MLKDVFERLEPCAPKGACTVLRGPDAGDRVRLPDVRHEVAYRSCSHERREPSVSPDESRGLNKERP